MSGEECRVGCHERRPFGWTRDHRERLAAIVFDRQPAAGFERSGQLSDVPLGVGQKEKDPSSEDEVVRRSRQRRLRERRLPYPAGSQAITRGKASNAPTITLLSPLTARAGTTFALTITGVNLAGVTEVTFSANGHGKDDGESDFTVKNVQAAANGTQVTASVTIAASAKPGARLVRVKSPNGESAENGVGAAVFTVLP